MSEGNPDKELDALTDGYLDASVPVRRRDLIGVISVLKRHCADCPKRGTKNPKTRLDECVTCVVTRLVHRIEPATLLPPLPDLSRFDSAFAHLSGRMDALGRACDANAAEIGKLKKARKGRP